MVLWITFLFLTAPISVRIPAGAEKFDIANLYVKVPSGSNILFLCRLDVLNVLYCHQPVPCACASDFMSCCLVKG